MERDSYHIFHVVCLYSTNWKLSFKYTYAQHTLLSIFQLAVNKKHPIIAVLLLCHAVKEENLPGIWTANSW
jgi:hypothetical protein